MKVMKGLTIEQILIDKIEKEGKKEHRKFSDQVCYILEQWLQEKESNNNGKAKKEK